MAETPDYIDVEVEDQKETHKRRRSDGGVYLVVADETEEFQIALRYAARRAQHHRAHVGILHVVNVEDFVHWSGVEARLRKEMREQAETFLWNTAKKVNELNGLIPVLYIGEGNRTDAIINIINEDMHIRALFLAGGTHATGPGPLVNYFTGKGLSRLRVPVTVVPGYLDAQKIDEVA